MFLFGIQSIREVITGLQNEKKKDKDLTQRIGKILKERDSVMSGIDTSTYPQAWVPNIDDLTTPKKLSNNLSIIS